MARLIIRKFIIMLIILGLLNYVAYHYALLHPRLFFSPAGRPVEHEIESHYPEYLQNLLAGDLGMVGTTAVSDIIRDPIKNSLILLAAAIFTTIVLGLLFGFMSISRRTRRMHPVALTFLAAGSSMPGFVFGAIILSFIVYRLLYSSNKTPLLPISGYGMDEHLILPVLVLAIQPTFHLAKITAGLLENELQKDYIQVARSKGLSWPQLIWSHALPNMLSPVLITIGEAMRLMVGALVIVEAIFLWPGIGRVFLLTIGLRLDARGPGVFFGVPELIAIIAVILGSWLLITDLLTSVLAYRLDPRLSRAAEEAEVTLA
ncbi:MAG: ABC transporter permease [Anaerolineae bacterium]|nr:ABC transporter permease [Anaerolineae bacterium]